MWIGYRWRPPIPFHALGLMPLNFVDQDHHHTTTPAITFPTETGTQFNNPDGMEGWIIHESAVARSWTQADDVKMDAMNLSMT